MMILMKKSNIQIVKVI